MTIDPIANGIEQPDCGTLVYEPAGTTEVKTEGASGPAAPDRRRCNLINGYQIIARIGAGGYGEVWRAQAPGGLAKAVKFVYGLADEKRASDEWKALLRIKDVRHPFLLSLERMEVVDGQLVVVTELADSSLKDRFDQCIAAGQPGIPRDELLGYLAEAADVLDYMAREHGLQHLDIKPENLLLVGGHMKVADFGLVKSVHDASVSMVGGLTPMFAAPESFDGRPSDRSDQYSLAIVYQLMLTGRVPFNGQTVAQLAAQHLNARPDLNSLPAADRPVVERALAKNPFDRYPGCRTLVERLRGNGNVVPMSVGCSANSPASRRGEPAHAASIEPARAEYKTEVIDVQAPAAGRRTGGANLDTKNVPHGTIVDRPPLEFDGGEALQPTLFVGLGGCGARTLRSLATRLTARMGPLKAIPAIRMLLIDTDFDGFRENFGQGTDAALSEKQFLYAPLRPTQYYRGKADDLTRWLSRRWIYNIPKTLKTDGARPLGRLALVDHVGEIDRRLREELTAMSGPDAVGATSQALNRVVEPQKPRVFIVGSISGGTGGGMVWDLAQLALQALPRSEDFQPEIICLLAHWSFPTAKELELATVNLCASLHELRHYVTEGCPGDPACHLPPLGRHVGLLDNVYLVNFGALGAEDEFDAAADVMAQYLDSNTASVAGSFTRCCRRSEAGPDRNTTGLRSFALAKIDRNDLLLADQVAQHLIGQTFGRWLTAAIAILDSEPVPSGESSNPGSPNTPSKPPIDPGVREIASRFDPLPFHDDQLSDAARQLLDVVDRNQLEREISRSLARELNNTFDGSSRLTFPPGADIRTVAPRSLNVALQRLLDRIVQQKVDAIQPALLVCGGTRRLLVVASRAMQHVGLVDLILQKLPAQATVAFQEQDEILLLCEASGVPANVVAASMTHDRPDLIDLATRMPTRCDISWTSC